MSAPEFAGRLTERVTLSAPAPERDGFGGWTGGWQASATVWASVEPVETALVDHRQRWRLTMRARALFVGDRIAWGTAVMRVRAVRRDPALADRILVIAEEEA